MSKEVSFTIRFKDDVPDSSIEEMLKNLQSEFGAKVTKSYESITEPVVVSIKSGEWATKINEFCRLDSYCWLENIYSDGTRQKLERHPFGMIWQQTDGTFRGVVWKPTYQRKADIKARIDDPSLEVTAEYFSVDAKNTMSEVMSELDRFKEVYLK